MKALNDKFVLCVVLLAALGMVGCTPSQIYMLPGDIPLVMLSIPAGTFNMGSATGDADETPVHAVTISQPFLMGETEVTKAQWEAVMGTQPWDGLGEFIDEDDAPVAWVSWDDAQAFVTALNVLTGETFRLPTEAEWEYACRAGTTTVYYFGDSSDNLSDYAWWRENSVDVKEGYGHVVGQLLPNAFGLFDMHGNLWEWCEDKYDEEYYSVSPSIDPQGPASGDRVTFRGGSFGDSDFRQRSAQRNYWFTDEIDGAVGFRVAR